VLAMRKEADCKASAHAGLIALLRTCNASKMSGVSQLRCSVLYDGLNVHTRVQKAEGARAVRTMRA